MTEDHAIEYAECPHCGETLSGTSETIEDICEVHHVQVHGCDPDPDKEAFDPWVWARMFHDGYVNNEVASTDYQVVGFDDPVVEDPDDHPPFPHVHLLPHDPVERITESVEGPLGRRPRLPRGRAGFDGRIH